MQIFFGHQTPGREAAFYWYWQVVWCVYVCMHVRVCVCVFVCVFRHDVREINCMLAGLIDAVMTSMDQKMPL